MIVRDPFNRSRPFHLNTGTAFKTASHVVHAGTRAIDSGIKVVNDMSSYALPSNGPSYAGPQRESENRAWGGSGLTARSAAPQSNGSVIGNVQDKVGGFFKDSKGDLPMYKDKPYASSRRLQPLWKRKRAWGTAGIFGVLMLWFLGFFGAGAEDIESEKAKWGWLSRSEKVGSKVNWNERREHVKDAFVLSWDAYERYAWGKPPLPQTACHGELMKRQDMTNSTQYRKRVIRWLRRAWVGSLLMHWTP